MTPTEIAVVYRRVEELIPYEGNARTHTPGQVTQIAHSIREFGFTNPILVDSGGGVVAGHGRLLAAQELGMTTVPTIELGHLTETQRRAYVLADNRIALNSGWDADMLTRELRGLQEMGAELGILGFDAGELEDLLKPASLEEDGNGDPDGLPGDEPFSVVEAGEVWLLGRHRLVCGDPAEPSVLALALGEVRPHLMVTEVPDGGDAKKDEGDWQDWREAVSIFAGDVAYLWHEGLFTGRVAGALQNAGFILRSQIIWDMDRTVARGGDYGWQHSACWYAAKEKKKRQFAGRGQSTIWRIPEPEHSEGDKRVRLPVECLKRCIENSSSQGHAVYDPFAGTGSTIIAAELAGRSCHAVESNPLNADVIITRWQAFTGLAATLDGDGRSYSDLRVQRALRA